MGEADLRFDPGRKRYYSVSSDLRCQGRFDFLNKDRVLIGRRRSGTHRYRLRNFDFHFSVGLPPVAENPSILVGSYDDANGSPLDFYGLGDIFVSTRLKQLLCDIDAEAFEMIECETRDAAGEGARPLLVDRCYPCARLRGRRAFRAHPPDGQSFLVERSGQSGRYMDLQDIWMKPEIGDAHAFRPLPGSHSLVFDEVLADACRRADMRGLRFTPLQPPTPAERVEHLNFDNYPYWTAQGYGE